MPDNTETCTYMRVLIHVGCTRFIVMFPHSQHIGKKIKLKKSKGDKDKHAGSKFEEGSVAQFRQLKYVRAHQVGLRTLVQQRVFTKNVSKSSWTAS